MKVYRSDFYLEGVYIYDTPSRMFWRGNIRAEGGIIKEIKFIPAESGTSGKHRRIIPALVDVHTHGRSGIDFAGASVEEMQKLREDYASVGTVTLLPTIASAPLEVMIQSVKSVKEAGYLGVHIEGRWLNEKCKGAHSPEMLARPNVKELERFLKAAEGIKVHITMAPELESGEEFVRAAVSAGATVSAGHTNMTVEEAYKALSWGVTGFTHTFNAMAPLHHRAPGVIAAALCSDAYAELICDGVHLHPETVRLVSKIKPRDKVVLVTDSMAATGCPDGVYKLGGLSVTVKDGKATTSEGTIAGSTLNLYQGMLNYMKFAGVPLEDAIDAATINPARMVGIDDSVGSLAVGKIAAAIEMD